MSCDGCIETAKARSRGLDSVIKKAANYAKEHNKTVAIYQAPEAPEGYAYIDVSLAAGLPILEYISPTYGHPA